MRISRSLAVSLTIHTVIIGALILIPILRQEELPPVHGGPLPVLVYYQVAPPPPPALQKGISGLATARPTPQVTAAPEIHQTAQPTSEPTEIGDERGTSNGSLDGMADGVAGGQVGGVPGGTIGGQVGGMGTIVMDYDQAPRLISAAKPTYPKNAFIKKIEGTVVIEIVIGADGRVYHPRVIESIPELDAAAVATVMQWTFQPAIKNGRPVTTVAQAPVKFSIY